MSTRIDDDGEILDDIPHWEPWTPEDLAERFDGVAARWYVVAGQAIDLFLGETTRPHHDIEIGVAADDFESIRRRVHGFDLEVIGRGDDGVTRRWSLDSAAFDRHFQTWVKDRASLAYRLDIFRDPHDDDHWICRRDRSIRRSYSDVIKHSDRGVPYLAPEVCLLFKAKSAGDKDHLDFSRVLPRLTALQRSWLRENLQTLYGEHPWVFAL
jgi:hypothetical protein